MIVFFLISVLIFWPFIATPLWAAVAGSDTDVWSRRGSCENATHKDCHFAMCGFVPQGKTHEEVCGNKNQTGWHALEDDKGSKGTLMQVERR